MRFTPLIAYAFLALALWRALRVRRDLERCETRWDRALFGSGAAISRAEQPLRYWCAIALNTAVVFLLALVAAAAFRATAFVARF